MRRDQSGSGYRFNDVTPDAALVLPRPVSASRSPGVPLAEDSLLVEAGFDLNLSPAATLGVLSGQLASNIQDNAVKDRFTWLF